MRCQICTWLKCKSGKYVKCHKSTFYLSKLRSSDADEDHKRHNRAVKQLQPAKQNNLGDEQKNLIGLAKNLGGKARGSEFSQCQ